MLVDRGTLQQEYIDMMDSFGPDELYALYNKSSNEIFNIDISNKVSIVYHLTSFKIGPFKDLIEDSIEKNSNGFELYIIITLEKLTANNMVHIQNAKFKNESCMKDLNMQYFVLAETLFNVTKHVLVPKHTVIKDEEEIEKIVTRYNLRSRLHLPLILKTDPIARYYDIKAGEIVQIVRVSPTAGEYIMYRCCV
jgi:DNA-directed RNA polymerase I, II, and III subunit RPABC1